MTAPLAPSARRRQQCSPRRLGRRSPPCFSWARLLSVWAWRTARRPRRQPTRWRTRPADPDTSDLRLWLQTEVTWSPDGRFIAYASDRDRQLRHLGATGGGRRSGAGDAVGRTGHCNRTGRRMAAPSSFRSERDGGGLFLVPALGGLERQLTSFGSYPSGLPDDPRSCFVDEDSARQLRGTATFVRRRHRREAHRAKSSRTSSVVGRGRGSHPIQTDGSPRSGSTAKFGRGFFTVSRDGRRADPVEGVAAALPLRVYGAGSFVRRRFRWHPSGTALYVQTESNGVYNLWRVHVDPKTLLWESAERLTTGAGPDVAAALSRDGTRLAFTTERGLDAPVGVSPRSGRASPRLRKPLTEDGARAVSPALSPDGRFLAYNLLRPGIAREELRITSILSERTASEWRRRTRPRAGRQTEKR